jgi:type II secretory pathway pseudopilin PulG
MHLTARTLRQGRDVAGFSLLEVVISAALLLVTITAVTTCVVGVSRAGARLEQAMDRDRALRVVADRLGALPFCADSYPQAGAEPGSHARDLVAAVFPHARPAQSTTTARYVAAGGDDGAPAGSFVTMLTEDGVPVTCVARFLAGWDGAAVDPDGLVGWDAATAAPPYCSMSVELTVRGGARGVTLVRSAMTEAPVAEPAVTAGAG